MFEHFEFHTEFEFEFNWNLKEHETIMIRHRFSKKINLTPGVTVASLHWGVTSTPGLLWCLPARLMTRHTSGLVHSISYMIEPMAEA